MTILFRIGQGFSSVFRQLATRGAKGRSRFAANHFGMVEKVNNLLALMEVEAMFGAMGLYAKKIREWTQVLYYKFTLKTWR